ncbi:hypothetical protein NDU88_006031 [Pleurodeles waltl]|uniref:Uncharacterized protein n=1 Tax=Pleurodeles waltl TaxID=8319 RepID=A0AAV7LN36_PLEWA|nr:hypothetical protein NDU88_006031 [Pleurodeles waltl]
MNPFLERKPRNPISAKRKLKDGEGNKAEGLYRTEGIENGIQKGKGDKISAKYATEEVPAQKALLWKKIEAKDGLNCDYAVLFDKAEADAIFSELENTLTYFSDTVNALDQEVPQEKQNLKVQKKTTFLNQDAGPTHRRPGQSMNPMKKIPEALRVEDHLSS